jgi:hypothetical protein
MEEEGSNLMRVLVIHVFILNYLNFAKIVRDFSKHFNLQFFKSRNKNLNFKKT